MPITWKWINCKRKLFCISNSNCSYCVNDSRYFVHHGCNSDGANDTRTWIPIIDKCLFTAIIKWDFSWCALFCHINPLTVSFRFSATCRWNLVKYLCPIFGTINSTAFKLRKKSFLFIQKYCWFSNYLINSDLLLFADGPKHRNNSYFHLNYKVWYLFHW